MTDINKEREEWAALANADTLHMLPQEALIASIKQLTTRLLEITTEQENILDQPKNWQDYKYYKYCCPKCKHEVVVWEYICFGYDPHREYYCNNCFWRGRDPKFGIPKTENEMK